VTADNGTVRQRPWLNTRYRDRYSKHCDSLINGLLNAAMIDILVALRVVTSSTADVGIFHACLVTIHSFNDVCTSSVISCCCCCCYSSPSTMSIIPCVRVWWTGHIVCLVSDNAGHKLSVFTAYSVRVPCRLLIIRPEELA